MRKKTQRSKFNAEIRVMVPADLRDQIEAEAVATARTISAVVRDALIDVRRRGHWQ